MSDITFTFTVPPSVGPPGLLYALRPQFLLTDGSPYGPASLATSFELVGATARRRLFETVDAQAAYLPCTGFSCVDRCLTAPTNNASAAYYTYLCANVVLPPD